VIVLAAGSQPNFFDTPGARQHALPLYSLRDAEVLRSRILTAFEEADRDPSRIDDGALNFVIVGGGPTGVETAGALADMIHMTVAASTATRRSARPRCTSSTMGPRCLGRSRTRRTSTSRRCSANAVCRST